MDRTERTLVFVGAVFPYLSCIRIFNLRPQRFLSPYGFPYGIILALSLLIAVIVRLIHRIRWGTDKAFNRNVTVFSFVVCTLLLATESLHSLHDSDAMSSFWPQFIEFSVLYSAICTCVFLATGVIKTDDKEN